MSIPLRFPELIKPYVDAYEQSFVGLMCWQSPLLVDHSRMDQALKALESDGKKDAGLALSKDLTGLPPGENPNIARSVRSSLTPLVAGKNVHRLISSLAQFLLGHCYAILDEDGSLEPHRVNPVVQFLRHVRNGCFHGNRFNIEDPSLKKRPWREAKWRGKEITLALNGARLFRESSQEGNGFLNWGDPVLLLSDVCAIVKPK